MRAKFWQLKALLEGERAGAIDGVMFDFRHAKMPGGGVWHAPGREQFFGLVFPWHRALFCGDERHAAQWVMNGAGEHSWPITQVFVGDIISVSRVQRLRRGGARPPYADEHDATEFRIHLSVERADGTITEPKTLVLLNARDAMGPHLPPVGGQIDHDVLDDFYVSLSKIRMRLERVRAAGVVPGTQKSEWLQLAERSFSRLPNMDGEGDELKADILSIMDLTAALGYALAKAETADIVCRAMLQTSQATATVRSKADPVRQAALAYANANPTTSQSACARHVAVLLKKGERQVQKQIEPMFETVKLSTGVPEKRVKAEYLTPVKTT